MNGDQTTGLPTDKRWWALTLLCLGELMIVLDTTIVNVALPSIRADLQFTESSLVWVVNAYMLTYGGFLLLGVYGFVCAGGGSIGELLGGLLTSTLNWHGIFLVDLPIGIAVCALCVALLPNDRVSATGERLDVAGAITITSRVGS